VFAVVELFAESTILSFCATAWLLSMLVVVIPASDFVACLFSASARGFVMAVAFSAITACSIVVSLTDFVTGLFCRGEDPDLVVFFLFVEEGTPLVVGSFLRVVRMAGNGVVGLLLVVLLMGNVVFVFAGYVSDVLLIGKLVFVVAGSALVDLSIGNAVFVVTVSLSVVLSIGIAVFVVAGSGVLPVSFLGLATASELISLSEINDCVFEYQSAPPISAATNGSNHQIIRLFLPG